MNKLLFAWILICPSLAHAQISLKVKVNDQPTGNPLNGAIIQVNPGNYTQVSETENTFSGLLPETFKVKVVMIGYAEQELSFYLKKDTAIVISLTPKIVLRDEVVITAIKSASNSINTEVMDKEHINRLGNGQDVPFIMQAMTSVLASSDAGAGIGYTGISVRGSDATRINVTVNGVPLNDAESHGQFWVNLPDLTASADEISLQKGLGASATGVAAFGANLNIQTGKINPEPFVKYQFSGGSFNTMKNNVQFGSGMLSKHFVLDGRVSAIQSDGFIDRASSKLNSSMFTGHWFGDHAHIRFNLINGSEKTYQAWNGVPQDTLLTNRTYNMFNYKNQTDNYKQQHYQLIGDFRKGNWSCNSTAHYTKGGGYYEEYRENELLESYGIAPFAINSDTFYTSNLVRQRWLDNDFYGILCSIKYQHNLAGNKRLDIILGGGINNYEGKHFGEIVWAQIASDSFVGDRYYSNSATKTDGNIYLKTDFYFTKYAVFFSDLQVRGIRYRFAGFDAQLSPGMQIVDFRFFNPRIGFESRNPDALISPYLFYGMGNREPVRDDFVNSSALSRPLPEKMHNIEAGTRWNFRKLRVHHNFYLQYYLNQLVLTGEINDVGAYTRTNVRHSYRAGTEVSLSYPVTKYLELGGNATLSENRIKNFIAYIDDYDYGIQQKQNYSNVPIAFSPAYIAACSIRFLPLDVLSMEVMMKAADRQFLDNSGDRNKSVDPYQFVNLLLEYRPKIKLLKELRVFAQINNVLNQLYETNGYTYSYIYAGQLTTENFYFPQAGTNLLCGFNLAF